MTLSQTLRDSCNFSMHYSENQQPPFPADLLETNPNTHAPHRIKQSLPTWVLPQKMLGLFGICNASPAFCLVHKNVNKYQSEIWTFCDPACLLALAAILLCLQLRLYIPGKTLTSWPASSKCALAFSSLRGNKLNNNINKDIQCLLATILFLVSVQNQGLFHQDMTTQWLAGI